MVFLNIMKRSLNLYSENLILIIPPLIEAASSFALSNILISLLAYPIPQASGESLPLFLPLFSMLFSISILRVAISFLVILGQASMTGKVFLEGKTGISDWGKGIKRFFLRVLGLSLIYAATLMAVFVAIIMASLLFILPQILSQLTGAMPLESLQIPSLTLAILSSIAIFLITIVTSTFYIWLASTVIDDRNIVTSLRTGARCIVESKKAFAIFVILFFLISLPPELIMGATSIFSFPMMLQSPSVYIEPTLAVLQLIKAVFSPLWFLIAFAIYNKWKTLV